jgi:hypothetical protein
MLLMNLNLRKRYLNPVVKYLRTFFHIARNTIPIRFDLFNDAEADDMSKGLNMPVNYFLDGFSTWLFIVLLLSIFSQLIMQPKVRQWLVHSFLLNNK